MIYEITDASRVSPLFGKWEETIIWSCLQGVMGKIYADDPSAPAAAMAMLGDFAFFAGKPNIELISYRPNPPSKNGARKSLHCGMPESCIIMVPQNESWKNMITDFYGKRAAVITRYATKKEPHIFDKKKLEKAVDSLPEQYTLSMIDERLYEKCIAETWCADLVSQFPDYESFRKLGIGAVICKEGAVISGASSYSRYREGIEIEIDTRKDYRRRGLAYICGAKLILECLKRNLYPSWDAQNKASIGLAEKLGYHYSHAYTAVEVRGY